MGENTYQIYNSSFGEVSEGLETPKIQINLLEGLTLQEVSFAMPVDAQTSTRRGRLSSNIAKVLAIIGVLILAIYFVPGIIEYANIRLSGSEVDNLTQASQNASGRALPNLNPSLPKTNRLIISSIGVDTDIEEATYSNYESALKKGVWRVSDFGQPDKTGAPIILAAHRFGYLAWTNSYRHYNSFYNLPKVKVGDTVTVYWQQREYVYGVYKTETGTAITDYSADVILYTCERLNGEERIFVYANLI